MSFPDDAPLTGGSSSSSSPPPRFSSAPSGAAAAQGREREITVETEGEDLREDGDKRVTIKVPVGLPPGSLTKSLFRGGRDAAAATMEIHRRYYHEKASVL